MQALVDNDIVIKGACYRLLPDLCAAHDPALSIDIGVLGSCSHVARHRIGSDTSLNDNQGALDALSTFVAMVEIIDPTERERELAADLETGARELGIPLDVGESQLCAVMVERAVPALLTGDKRAIRAMERLLDVHGWLSHLSARVYSLEQLVLALTSIEGVDTSRTKICSERTVDTALDTCFRCHESAAAASDVHDALTSYIDDLRAAAPRVLAD
jgi:hypothetical protein